MDLDFREHRLKISHDAAQAGSKKPILPSLSPIPLRFEYCGNLIWDGLETYKKCEGVMGDVLTIARSNNSQDCYVARPVSEFLSECYQAFGLHLLSWITRVCEKCQKLESNTTSKDFVSMRNRISQTKPNEVTQGLAESETANRQISTEREDFDPEKEVIAKLKVTGATNIIIKGYLEAGQLRWALSTPSKVLASEIKSTLSWTLSALRCQPKDAEGLYFCTPVSLDTGLPEITRFELISIESCCWTNLFSYACITDLPSLGSAKEGLEIDFSLLLQLAAVDQEVVTENGPIFLGFHTALIPLDPPESKRWHFLATEGRQITPARVKREFGKRKKEKMEGSNVWFQGNLEQDYRKGNVYVGWCTAPLVEIRSDTTSVDVICKASGLPPVQHLEELTERSSGNDVSFFSRIGFFGFSIGASGGKKKERKFKQVSLVAKYTQERNFEGVLTSARATPCILWDQYAERAWLVSAVSALLLASMRYVKWKKYSFKSMQIDGQFRSAPVDHAPEFTNTTIGPETALRKNQMLLVDRADGVTVNDEVLFQDIVKQMWTEMSIGEDLCCSSATGKKHEEKECIIGYDLNEVVCGKKIYLRSLRVSPCIKNWQPLAHANEAQVIFCRDIGTVIRCNPPTEPRDCCTWNCPKGALSCLIQDLRTFYSGCWDGPLNLPTPPPNAGALSIGHDYEWIPRGCMPGSPKEVELCSRSLLSIATTEPQSRKLQKKKLQTREVQKEKVELLPWTFTVLVTFGSVVIATN